MSKTRSTPKSAGSASGEQPRHASQGKPDSTSPSRPLAPPLPPKRRLLAVMWVLFGAWVIFLIALYVTTVLMASK